MRWGAVAAGATATRGGSRPLRARVSGPSVCISIGSPAETTSGMNASFLFLHFSKKLQKYIFDFKIYSFIPLPPGRGAAGAYM